MKSHPEVVQNCTESVPRKGDGVDKGKGQQERLLSKGEKKSEPKWEFVGSVQQVGGLQAVNVHLEREKSASTLLYQQSGGKSNWRGGGKDGCKSYAQLIRCTQSKGVIKAP